MYVIIESSDIISISNGVNSISYNSMQEFVENILQINSSFSHTNTLKNLTWFNYEPENNIAISSDTSLEKDKIVEIGDFFISIIHNLLSIRDVYWNLDRNDAILKAKYFIKNEYLKAEASGYTDQSTGIKWDCNNQAISDIMAALKMMELTLAESIEFIDFNDDKHALTYDELKTMGLKVGVWWQRLKYQKNYFYSQIDECETVAAVRGITWVLPEEINQEG